MRNLKIILALLSLLIVVIILSKSSNNDKLTSKPLIITSNFAIYDVIKHISGDKIEVVSILPFGVDPHSFEPTPKEVVLVEKSKLFFYSGDVLEPWVENVAPEKKSVDVSKYVTLQKLEDDDHKHEGHQDEGEPYDPHYWLDIDNMKNIAQMVTEKLSTLDPKNKHFFEKNKKIYITNLTELDNLYKAKLLSCKKEMILVSHDAFGYLGQRYGFHGESLTGFSTEAEPTAADIKHIFQHIKDDEIKTVFFESFSSKKNMQTVADDLGIEIDSLQPLGNITAEEKDQNLTYVGIMKINLDKIAKALQCD